MKRYFGIVILALFCCTGAIADENIHLYGTGRIMEIDRCASAWLIKRYADPKAEFIFFQDGELIARGTAFDTPDARFNRTHNMATFEVLLHHFKIDDPKLKTLAGAIHEIEINYWAGRSGSALAAELVVKISDIIRTNPEPGQCLEQCFRLLDSVMKQL